MKLSRWFSAVAVLLLTMPILASAHPLGNFTINQYLAIHIEPEIVEIDFIIDRAEIPASQVLGGGAFADRESPTPGELAAFSESECQDVTDAISVDIDGNPVRLAVADSDATAPEGAGGLATLRTECFLTAEIDIADRADVTVRNENFADRIGWTEIVLTAADLAVETDLATESITDRLTIYPEDRLASPPDLRQALFVVEVEPGDQRGVRFDPGTTPQAQAQSTGDRFSSLLDEADGGFGAMVTALGIAFVLGAGHAAAPGHGKTVMAASLIGTKGRVKHALILGLSVAVSHTAGVFVLGLITFAASTAFAPEAVFPYLTALSGVIVTAIGGWILRQWLLARRRTTSRVVGVGDHAHTESYEHDHPTDDHAHDHDGDDHTHGDDGHGSSEHSHVFGGSHTHAVLGDREVTWKLLATLGLSGGLVPSVSAILLLLAAINLGRVGLGLILILMFGVGMATTLVGVGIGVVFIGERGLARLEGGSTIAKLKAYLTPIAGLIVLVIGVALTVRALFDIL